MKNKYHFVLIKNKKESNSEGMWYLIPDSIDTIREHFRTYIGGEIKEGMKQMVERGSGSIGHYSNRFAAVVEDFAESTGVSRLEAATTVELQMYESRVRLFSKGKTLYLSPSLAVFLGNDDSEIVNEVYLDTLVYPHEVRPTINDVKFTQWQGGLHWYAKIGKIDIVDKEGNQKWNTIEEAQNASRWYINSHYKSVQ